MDPLNALRGQKKDAKAQDVKPPASTATAISPKPSSQAAEDAVAAALTSTRAPTLPVAVGVPVTASTPVAPGTPTAVGTPVAQTGQTGQTGTAQASAPGYPRPEKRATGAVSSETPGLADMTFPGILAGEKVVQAVKSCALQVQSPFCEVPGRICITPFRLKFMTPKGGLRKDLQWMRGAKYFDVPFGLVETIKDEKLVTVTGATELRVTITCKDLRCLVFILRSEQDSRLLLDSVESFGTPGNPAMLFAFKFADALRKDGLQEEHDSGWDLYDPEQDYARMGIDTLLIPNPQCPWRVSDLNKEYKLCSSYPAFIVLPRRMPDQALRDVAAFRKRGRLPAMSWCGGPELSFASLWRCSQTTEGLTGLIGTKCVEDQSMLNAIRLGNGSSERDLLCIDLRPKVSAWVNKAGGGGFESYPQCRMIWGGIDNIHVVRDAWRAMGSAVARLVDTQVGSWMKDVASSGWYDYIGAILSCTLKVVTEVLNFKANVVIHCSDGWDRTAQVSSLAMLCMDPHYRTQVGFLKLIQKEWCSFGHRFRTRLAIGDAPTSEYSPVIIQWLECVFQLLQQFPDAFEFSTSILVHLAEEVFTNRYGTFFFDNERERRSVEAHTVSLWSVLLQPEEFDHWRNPGYKAQRVHLYPSICQANYVVWEAYWFRYHVRGESLPAESSSWPSSESPKSQAMTDVPEAPAQTPTAPPEPSQVSPESEELEREPGEPMSLFSPAELTAPKPEPTQLFADDDEDIFAKPNKTGGS
mmetsp:Transcript_74424/g.150480  ORF Transcript_74424/g.150480 Transcript_74424/m.150480 type:complete len:752 (-) Transcript_74424:51-2306(-)